jgi:hypothetical protein
MLIDKELDIHGARGLHVHRLVDTSATQTLIFWSKVVHPYVQACARAEHGAAGAITYA